MKTPTTSARRELYDLLVSLFDTTHEAIRFVRQHLDVELPAELPPETVALAEFVDKLVQRIVCGNYDVFAALRQGTPRGRQRDIARVERLWKVPKPPPPPEPGFSPRPYRHSRLLLPVTLVASVVATVLLSASADPSPLAGPILLSGKLVDENGNGVTSPVEVAVGSCEQTVRYDGGFALRLDDECLAAPMILQIRADGHRMQQHAIADPDRFQQIIWNAARLPKLSGTVAGRDDSPLVGVEIRVIDCDFAPVTTDDRGHFALGPLGECAPNDRAALKIRLTKDARTLGVYELVPGAHRDLRLP